MKSSRTLIAWVALATLFTMGGTCYHLLAQDTKKADAKPADNTAASSPTTEFAEYLTGAVLTGVFTVDGQPLNKLNEERYEIKTAKPIEGEKDLWEIVTRIKYGDKDIEVPVEINVEWVGKTPVMVMDSVSLPVLGTFSARVVFHDRKYAGTWKHDSVGGHLFGRVEKAPAKEKP